MAKTPTKTTKKKTTTTKKKTESTVKKVALWSIYIPLVVVVLSAAGYGGWRFYNNHVASYVTATTEVVKQEVLNPAELTKVRETREFYVLADRADGRLEMRTGGSTSWRLHNPGLLAHGKFTRSVGAIGSDGRHAIFPSYELGRRANEILLFESEEHEYMGMSVVDAIKKYAPKKDGFDPVKYAESLAKAAGVETTKILKDFTTEQRKKFLDAIEKHEHFKEGKVTIFKDEAEFQEKGY